MTEKKTAKAKAAPKKAVKSPKAASVPKKQHAPAAESAPKPRHAAVVAKPDSGAAKSALGVAKPARRKGRYWYATGKRKTAVARVKLFEGSGQVMVGGRPADEYFFGIQMGSLRAPLKIVEMEKRFDVEVEVEGGGISAQSDAVRHGIAKALTVFDAALRPTLKKAGFLTRDSRVKERKKYGLKRARRAPQFSKR